MHELTDKEFEKLSHFFGLVQCRLLDLQAEQIADAASDEELAVLISSFNLKYSLLVQIRHVANELASRSTATPLSEGEQR